MAVSCEPGVNWPETDRLAPRRRQIDARDSLLTSARRSGAAMTRRRRCAMPTAAGATGSRPAALPGRARGNRGRGVHAGRTRARSAVPDTPRPAAPRRRRNSRSAMTRSSAVVSLRIARCDEQPGLPSSTSSATPPTPRGDHGKAGDHGLEHRDGQSLRPAGEDEHIGGPEEPGNVPALAQEAHAVADAEPFDLGLERWTVGPSPAITASNAASGRARRALRSVAKSFGALRRPTETRTGVPRSWRALGAPSSGTAFGITTESRALHVRPSRRPRACSGDADRHRGQGPDRTVGPAIERGGEAEVPRRPSRAR
jgi:hypothetical protein